MNEGIVYIGINYFILLNIQDEIKCYIQNII